MTGPPEETGGSARSGTGAASADLVLVTSRWDERGGGRERYAAELVAGLGRRGVLTRVLCQLAETAARATGWPPQAFGPGRRGERRLDAAVRQARASTPAVPVLALAPCAAATHYQLHSGLHRDAFRAEREAMSAGLRRAFYEVGLRLNARRQRLLRLEEKVLRRNEARLMVFSPQQEVRLCALGVPAERIRCSRLGVDAAVFHPPAEPGPEGASRQLLFAGHNYALKGLGPVLEALARLRLEGAGVELLVAGRGKAAPFLRRARALGIGSAVRFLGDLDQNRLADLYRSSAALVINSFHDPAPRVLLEALACGCPVVASRRVGGCELLRPGAEGEIVEDPGDAAQVAAALRRVLGPPAAGRRRSAAELGARFGFDSHLDEVQRWLWP
jgi:glycosyltransferase involved in cell wall biosynthesis